MVNWIHVLGEEMLDDILAPLLKRTRYLIVDSIDAGGPASYRHNHNFSFLDSMAQRISTVRVSDEPRSLLLFKVTA